jgi:hypothetical protein
MHDANMLILGRDKRAIAAAALLISAGGACAGEDHAGHAGKDKVGTVRFVNSCAPAVQADIARGVAMLAAFLHEGKHTRVASADALRAFWAHYRRVHPR